MKYELNVPERDNLLKLLPTEGNFATLKSLRIAREALSLTEEEYVEFGAVPKNDGTISLKPSKKLFELKTIELGDFAVSTIKAKLKNLDEQSKLTADQFTIYTKFIEEGEANANN